MSWGGPCCLHGHTKHNILCVPVVPYREGDRQAMQTMCMCARMCFIVPSCFLPIRHLKTELVDTVRVDVDPSPSSTSMCRSIVMRSSNSLISLICALPAAILCWHSSGHPVPLVDPVVFGCTTSWVRSPLLGPPVCRSPLRTTPTWRPPHSSLLGLATLATCHNTPLATPSLFLRLTMDRSGPDHSRLGLDGHLRVVPKKLKKAPSSRMHSNFASFAGAKVQRDIQRVRKQAHKLCYHKTFHFKTPHPLYHSTHNRNFPLPLSHSKLLGKPHFHDLPATFHHQQLSKPAPHPPMALCFAAVCVLSVRIKKDTKITKPCFPSLCAYCE